MRRIRIIVEYEGTNYVGWQQQPNGVSVQELLQNALFELTGERLCVHGSGRTDSGVHARAQVAHFDCEARMPADKFAIAMNTHLPADVRVLYSDEADESFHSRFTPKLKCYCYTVRLGAHADVFSRSTALHVHRPLSFEAMQCAACDLVGRHDFRAFMSAGVTMENTVRTVSRCEWVRDGQLLHLYIAADGFLYNMVRIAAGTLIEIGGGRLPVDTIKKAIESHDRADAGATAPAHGLMLYSVRYEGGFDTEEALNGVI
ncbi:MAG TPA: tRNA pseudouridine(38-40) synthase TruA [Clostridia bacterium]|jgi:tRNA pseudouridine38-40 synthase|nr:tRNA pseudouridine(38-40) synthase TruA [Clostridia bacterium]